MTRSADILQTLYVHAYFTTRVLFEVLLIEVLWRTKSYIYTHKQLVLNLTFLRSVFICIYICD